MWRYPLVVAQRAVTFGTFGTLIGDNALFNQAALSSATTHLVVSPNTDTLYSVVATVSRIRGCERFGYTRNTIASR